MLRTMVVSMVAALVLTTLGGASMVSTESQATSITIEGMHCAGCAKKVAARLLAVTGVADAQVNAETGCARSPPRTRRRFRRGRCGKRSRSRGTNRPNWSARAGHSPRSRRSSRLFSIPNERFPMKRFAVLIGVALFVGCSAANEPEAGKKDPHGAGQHGDHAGGASGAMLMVQTIPKALKAGEAGSLNLMVHDADGTMVREFDVNHDKLANLIIVRDGLDEFAHIHPEVDGQGNMTATHAFPKAGKYRLFVDYKPKGKSAATATAVVEVIGEATVVVTAIAPIAQDYEPRVVSVDESGR